jgi:hypothetical protein
MSPYVLNNVILKFKYFIPDKLKCKKKSQANLILRTTNILRYSMSLDYIISIGMFYDLYHRAVLHRRTPV